MQEVNRCAYLDSNHKFTILKEPKPKLTYDEVLVRIVANGICGSDIHFYHEGRLGNFTVTKPYIPGHEASGVIEEVGKGVENFVPGDHVVIEPGIPCGKCRYCKIGRYNLCKDVIFLSAPPINGTFCDYITIRSDCIHKFPEDMSFEQAALIEPVAVAIHAVNRAHFRNGDTAVIVGAGTIGLLTMQAFKAAGGSKVICMDMAENRLEIAKKLGADAVINVANSNEDFHETADVIFETAGSTAATSSLFNIARIGGCVVQVGWPGNTKVEMNIANFLDKELDYVGVNRYANSFPTAISWVSDGRINVNKLITNRFEFDKITEAFEFSLKNPGEVIKTVVIN
jgi:L-iditol 2-dehydrogenase